VSTLKIIVSITLLVSFWVPVAQGGKPWRAGLDELISRSSVIVVGTVVKLEPSGLKDEYGSDLSIAKVKVKEILKGKNETKQLSVLTDSGGIV
jgi:hypothetical protein